MSVVVVVVIVYKKIKSCYLLRFELYFDRVGFSASCVSFCNKCCFPVSLSIVMYLVNNCLVLLKELIFNIDFLFSIWPFTIKYPVDDECIGS